jgi:hypothetical protein
MELSQQNQYIDQLNIKILNGRMTSSKTPHKIKKEVLWNLTMMENRWSALCSVDLLDAADIVQLCRLIGLVKPLPFGTPTPLLPKVCSILDYASSHKVWDVEHIANWPALLKSEIESWDDDYFGFNICHKPDEFTDQRSELKILTEQRDLLNQRIDRLLTRSLAGYRWPWE